MLQPLPSAWAVREGHQHQLPEVFQLRTCETMYSRIARALHAGADRALHGACVGRIQQADYRDRRRGRRVSCAASRDQVTHET